MLSLVIPGQAAAARRGMVMRESGACDRLSGAMSRRAKKTEEIERQDEVRDFAQLAARAA
jgi:hypothetical protein